MISCNPLRTIKSGQFTTGCWLVSGWTGHSCGRLRQLVWSIDDCNLTMLSDPWSLPSNVVHCAVSPLLGGPCHLIAGHKGVHVTLTLDTRGSMSPSRGTQGGPCHPHAGHNGSSCHPHHWLRGGFLPSCTPHVPTLYSHTPPLCTHTYTRYHFPDHHFNIHVA